MIEISNVNVFGWESAIAGMRNPMNSWDKSDSFFGCKSGDYGRTEAKYCNSRCRADCEFCIGQEDMKLMKKLIKAGKDHRKFLRMIHVQCDINAPMYWWKECDTYKIGTVRNSCSTMHKIHSKEFDIDDFSYEYLSEFEDDMWVTIADESRSNKLVFDSVDGLKLIILLLNHARELFIKTKDKKYWWQMIQLLPSSYNQRSTLDLNYEVLMNMYYSRKHHKLDEWRDFCKWVESLPYMNHFLNTNETHEGVDEQLKLIADKTGISLENVMSEFDNLATIYDDDMALKLTKNVVKIKYKK